MAPVWVEAAMRTMVDFGRHISAFSNKGTQKQKKSVRNCGVKATQDFGKSEKKKVLVKFFEHAKFYTHSAK